MLLKRLLLFLFLIGFNQATASYNLSVDDSSPSANAINFIDSIDLIGNDQQRKKLRIWLSEIAEIPKGRSTLKAIAESGHKLTIKHSHAALLSAGRTIAPMTEDLINGVGADVTIIFDAEINDNGSHKVYGKGNQLIEFTAIQNLYHELAHAMHQMQGTWRYFASEKQAIEEENIFRQQLAKINGKEPRLRYRKTGVLITSMETAQLGYELPAR